MFKNYAKLMGRITHTAVGVNGIKNVYTQTLDISKMLIKDNEGKFALRPGAISRLEDSYNNAPAVEGRVNFINSMFKTGLRDRDIDKSYTVEKISAQLSFLMALGWATFAGLDFVQSSGLMVTRDLGALAAAFMSSAYWFKSSLSAFQYRTYTKCTVKQWISSEPQWWAEAFKIKEPFSRLNVVMYPKLIAYKSSEINALNNRIAY